MLDIECIHQSTNMCNAKWQIHLSDGWTNSSFMPQGVHLVYHFANHECPRGIFWGGIILYTTHLARVHIQNIACTTVKEYF